jgi:hypothetical protein
MAKTKKDWKDKAYQSVVMALHRVMYGRPGRQAKIPRRPRPDQRPPAGPWSVAQDGTKRTDTEPLDYPPLQVVRKTQELTQIYAELVRVSAERENRYKDYEDMILDATLAAAIELMVDDACQFNRERSASVWVKSDNERIRRALEELFDIIQIEEKLFDWAYNMAMYGDFFLQVEGQEGRGILLVQDDWHPADVQRLDVNGALIGFRTPRTFVETTQVSAAGVLGDSDFHDPWEFVHFRIQASQRRRREIERERMAPMIRFEKDKYRLTTRYGVAVVEAVRRIYKQLAMVEQSMIISRMTRAVMKYIYKVQCGQDAEMKQAVETVLQMKELLTQQTGIKIGESFEQTFAPLSGSEDFFLPVFGEKGDVTIETLGGETNVQSIVDIEYLRAKLFGGLKVPGAYLGLEDNLPGSLGESALLRLDIRYARTVKRIQRAVVQGLTRLAQIHLAYKKLPVDPKLFSIEMDVISTAEEEERKASLMSALTVAGDLTALNTQMRIGLPPKKFAKLVYTDVLGLSGKFIELVDEAEVLPSEAEMEVAPAPGGVGGLPGAPGEVAPEEPEVAPEGELEVPPEAAAEEPGAEVPGEGELEMPPGVEGEKQRFRKSKSLKERAAVEAAKREVEGPARIDKIGAKNPDIGIGIIQEAKRQAMESVTRAARHSTDVRAETPRFDSGGHRRPSKLVHWQRSTDLRKVLEFAITVEKDERKKEKDRRDKVMEKLRSKVGEVEVMVASAGKSARKGGGSGA